MNNVQLVKRYKLKGHERGICTNYGQINTQTRCYRNAPELWVKGCHGCEFWKWIIPPEEYLNDPNPINQNLENYSI